MGRHLRPPRQWTRARGAALSTRVALGALATLATLATLVPLAACTPKEDGSPGPVASSGGVGTGTDNASSGMVAGWAPGRPGLEAQRASGSAEIGEAQRQLRAAGMNCDDACPALVAMRTGVGHVCRVTDTKEDGKVCAEWRVRLLAEETRLRPPCGMCAPPKNDDGGDADAPPGPGI